MTENITGDVLVTKNPCTHPGDIRKLKAVSLSDDPDKYKPLSYLTNVVVFPIKGQRP